MSFYKSHAPKHREHTRELNLPELEGMRALRDEGQFHRGNGRRKSAAARNSVSNASTPSRTNPRSVASSAASCRTGPGINTFLKTPYLEDVRKVGEYDVAFVGVPFDIGTTYRAGTRFGPQGIRRISSLYTTYNFELGVDLRESLKMCDVGDIWCPANITKGHDQITKGVAHILSQERCR